MQCFTVHYSSVEYAVYTRLDQSVQYGTGGSRHQFAVAGSCVEWLEKGKVTGQQVTVTVVTVMSDSDSSA